MATWERFVYTGRDSRDAVSKRFLKHHRIKLDLEVAGRLAQAISQFDLTRALQTDQMLVFESLWIALTTRVYRCFGHSERGGLSPAEIPGFEEYEQDIEEMKRWRDKQVAHPSNEFETAEIVFHINDETTEIGGPSFGISQPITPPSVPLQRITQLIELAIKDAESRIAADQQELAKRKERPDFRDSLRK